METRERRPVWARGGFGDKPWWLYMLIIPGVYIMAWVLHWLGVIPGK